MGAKPKFYDLLNYLIIEIRAAALDDGERAHLLANAIHHIPAFFKSWDDDRLAEYVKNVSDRLADPRVSYARQYFYKVGLIDPRTNELVR